MALGKRDEDRRLRAQIDLILGSLDNVAVGPDSRYLFRDGAILVRDHDLARVRAVVEGNVEKSLVTGLTLFRPSQLGTLEALAQIDARIGVGVATPDHVVSICPPTFCPAIEPDDPGQTTPSPPVSTEKQCDGSGVLVSVVDTGWLDQAAATHSWLKGVTGDAEPPYMQGQIPPYGGHGTFIAGVVRCMAPKSTVIVERVPVQGAGAWFESDMVAQLEQALGRGSDIISLSAGTNTRDDRQMLSLEVFYETRLKSQKGTILVAAAGNQAERAPFWPAAFPWAVSVGALDAALTGRAGFSNFGGWVDVFAPGEDLVNAFAEGTYTYREPPNVPGSRKFKGLAKWSGTSFSTPLVAGLIAARMSARGINSRRAADELLLIANAKARRGVGPILQPGDACAAVPSSCSCCSEPDGHTS